MSAADRHHHILETLQQHGSATIAELSAACDVSEMTIRRDLATLEGSGLLRRTHGGAVRTAGSSFEPPFAMRQVQNVEAKERIAAEIAGRLEDGQTVVLDGGSTGVAVARALLERDLTVCALSLRVADVLAESASIRLMVPGGFVRRGELSFSGPSALRTLGDHQFDTYVMTVSGIDGDAGLTEWNVDDAATKRAALDASRTCLVAADSTKFGQLAFARVAPLGAVDVIVTDAGLDSDLQRDIRPSATLHIA